MSYTLLENGERRAKKSHKCEWCGEAIEVGEVYGYSASVCDGDLLGFEPFANERGRPAKEGTTYEV